MEMRRPEELWLSLCKHQMAQFYLPIGQKLKKKIMQERIGQNLQKDKNLKSCDTGKYIILIKSFTFFFILKVFHLANIHLQSILHFIYFPFHQLKYRTHA